jgi:hypothetical protein
MADNYLDQVRGGFALPNGMDVTVGIDIQTLVNGVLALRTVLTAANQGVPVVFTGTGNTSSAPAAQGGTSTTIPGVGAVRVVEGPASPADAGVGEQRVELTPNGPAVSTPSGSIQLTQNGGGSVVSLTGNSLELSHMIGSATGSLVANTADNRSIDTVVTVNVDLQNSAIPVGNALLRLNSMAIDAASRGIR